MKILWQYLIMISCRLLISLVQYKTNAQFLSWITFIILLLEYLYREIHLVFKNIFLCVFRVIDHGIRNANINKINIFLLRNIQQKSKSQKLITWFDWSTCIKGNHACGHKDSSYSYITKKFSALEKILLLRQNTILTSIAV